MPRRSNFAKFIRKVTKSRVKYKRKSPFFLCLWQRLEGTTRIQRPCTLSTPLMYHEYTADVSRVHRRCTESTRLLYSDSPFLADFVCQFVSLSGWHDFRIPKGDARGIRNQYQH